MEGIQGFLLVGKQVGLQPAQLAQAEVHRGKVAPVSKKASISLIWFCTSAMEVATP